MANKKKRKQAISRKFETSDSTFTENFRHILTVTIVVLVILGIFYLLTVYLINRDEDNTTKEVDTNNSKIQYEEIMAGSSFSISEDQYIVLYYDKSDEELSNDIDPAMTSYEHEKDISIYTVDLSKALNQSVVSTEANPNPSKASDLAINGETLILFYQGEVEEYIEGKDSILEYLGE